MTHNALFWTAMALIVEPALAKAWPRFRAALLLSYPYKEGEALKISEYYNHLDERFGIMCPFRIKARRWMQTIGVIILIILYVKLNYSFYV